MPSFDPQRTAGSARAGSRATTYARSMPRSTRPASAAHAVPPAPTTTPYPDPAKPAARSAPTTPSTSVQSARHPDSWRTSVFAAPTATARAVAPVATDNAACLPGIVTDSPAHDSSKEDTRAGSAAASASIRS